MKTSLYIFVFFIGSHSSALNRIFTIGIDKGNITSYESKGKTSGSKNKPPLISEIIQNMLYLL